MLADVEKNTNKVRYQAFGVLIVSGLFLNFPMFDLSIGVVSSSYLFVFFVILTNLKKANWDILFPVCFFIANMLFSAVGAFEYGANAKIITVFNVLLGSYAGICLFRTYRSNIGDLFSSVSMVALLVNLVRDIVHLFRSGFTYKVEDFFFITNGGPNIELSVLASLSVLCRSVCIRFTVIFYVLLKAFIYESRSAIIISAISVLFYLKDRANLKSFYVLICLFGVCTLAIGLLFFESIKIQFLARFFSVDVELRYFLNEQGRMYLWASAIDLVRENILGYGVGNGVPLLEARNYINVPENNFHNIYLQYLVEGGIVSALLFIFLASKVVKCVLSGDKVVSTTVGGASVVIITGLFQWTGFGMFEWVLLGMFMAETQLSKEGRNPSVSTGRRVLSYS